MMEPTSAADLLCTSVRERQEPHVIKELLLRVAACPHSQQQLLSDAQGVEVLVHLLQHKEPSLQLEACLALACIQLPSGWQCATDTGPLAAALASLLLGSKQHNRTTRSASTSSTQSRSKSGSRKTTTTTITTPDMTSSAASITWPSIPRLAAAAFLCQAPKNTLGDLCQDRPALVATLAQLAVEQVEGTLHGAVEEQQQQAIAAGQQAARQQQPWQLPAASAAMAGLLQLLSCGVQQVHCSVVHQVCRLAYSTAVLDQLGVGLAGYPGAVAAVVALVQPWSQEGFWEAMGGNCSTPLSGSMATTDISSICSTDSSGTSQEAADGVPGPSDDSATTSNTHTTTPPTSASSSNDTPAASTTTTASSSSNISSSQWPGGAAQLQAEAAATLMVLASLGKGSKEVVTRDAATVHGLLQALSSTPWQEVGQEQQQEEQGQQQLQKQEQEQPEQQQAKEEPSLHELFTGLRRVITLRNLPTNYMRYVVSLVFSLMVLWLTCCFELVLSWRVYLHLCKTAVSYISQNGGWSLIRSLWVLLSGTVMHFAWRCVRGAVSLAVGVMFEVAVWVIAPPILALQDATTPMVRLMRGVFARRSLEPPSNQQWVRLRQQWAAYCLWHLVCDGRPSKNVWQQHTALARKALSSFLSAKPVHCPCAAQFVVDVVVQSGLVTTRQAIESVPRRPASELKGIEPPPPPHFPSTRQYRLNAFALTAVEQAWADIDGHLMPALIVAGLLPMVGVGAGMLARLPYLGALKYLAGYTPLVSSCILGPAAAGACSAGVQAVLGAAAALVVTASSRGCEGRSWLRLPGSYQVVVASRPAPAAAPPRTWLQPVSYLATDLAPFLSSEGTSSALAKYECFGQWPPVAPFHPVTCSAQHVVGARKGWLDALSRAQWLFMVLVIVDVVWQRQSPVLYSDAKVETLAAAVEQAMSAGTVQLLLRICPLLYSIAQVAFYGMEVVGVLLPLCCAVLQPNYFFIRRLVRLCWWLLCAACKTAASIITGTRSMLRRAFGHMGSALLSLPHVVWCGVKAAVCAAAQGVVSAAVVTASQVVWFLRLPLRLVSNVQGAMLAAGATPAQQAAPAAAARSSMSSAHHDQHSSSAPEVQGPGGSSETRPQGKQHNKAAVRTSRPMQQVQRGDTSSAMPAAVQEEAVPDHAATAASGSSTNSRIVDGSSKGSWNGAGSTDAGTWEGLQQDSAAAAAGSSTLTAVATPASASAAGGGHGPAATCPSPTFTPPATPNSSTPGLTSTGHVAGHLPTGEAPAAASTTPPSEDQSDSMAPSISQNAGGSGTCMPSALEVSSSPSSSNGRPPMPVIIGTGSFDGSSSSPTAPVTPAAEEPRAAVAAAQQAAHEAARVAAAAAAAAGHPLEKVHLAAARAAAEALQGAAAPVPSVEASMLVVQAAAAAAGLYAGGPAITAAPTVAAAPAPAAMAAAGSSMAVPAGNISHNSMQAAGTAAAPRPRKPRRRAECVVCLDARPSVTTHPCGHRVLCGGCAALVAAGKGECPMCRAPVVRYEAGGPGGRG